MNIEDHTYPCYPIYSNSKVSDIDFIKVCNATPKLTLNPKYLTKNFQQHSVESTIFKEIRMLTPIEKIHPDFAFVLSKEREPTPVSIGEFTKGLYLGIKDYFKTIWDPNQQKICHHSSGYDSRIISGILVHLRDEMGEDWIGNLHFRAHAPECDQFLQIMKHQRWKTDQYSIWDKPIEFYDVTQPEHAVNGFANYQVAMNFWKDIIPIGEEKNWVEISGSGGGEFANYPLIHRKIRRKLLDFVFSIRRKRHHCENENFNRYLNCFPDFNTSTSYRKIKFKALIRPYFSYSFLVVALNVQKRFYKQVPGSTDLIRHELLKLIDPELLKIPRLSHNYRFMMSEEHKKKLRDFWEASRLYSDYKHLKSVYNVDPTNIRDRFTRKLFGFATCYEKIEQERLNGP